MASFEDKPILDVSTTAGWEHWLETVADPAGVRLKLKKKNALVEGITYREALDVALCFGWIDGQGKSFDEHYSLQSYTPRRKNSPWSKINRDHVARLIEEGRMRPEGLAEVERAQADGRWEAAYRQKDAPVPEDFQRALDAVPDAAAFFATLTGSARFAFLFRLGSAKRAETRARRIETYIDLLRNKQTLR